MYAANMKTPEPKVALRISIVLRSLLREVSHLGIKYQGLGGRSTETIYSPVFGGHNLCDDGRICLSHNQSGCASTISSVYYCREGINKLIQSVVEQLTDLH